MSVCKMRAPRKTKANGSVTAVLPESAATTSKPPKIGSPSKQLAWARASLCINGDRFEFSGLTIASRL